eukprot:380562_1
MSIHHIVMMRLSLKSWSYVEKHGINYLMHKECSKLYWTLLRSLITVINAYFNILCYYIFNKMVQQISVVYLVYQIINQILVKHRINKIFYHQKQLFLYVMLLNIIMILCYYILNNFIYGLLYWNVHFWEWNNVYMAIYIVKMMAIQMKINDAYFNILCWHIFNKMVQKIYIHKIINKSKQILIIHSLHQIINQILVRYVTIKYFTIRSNCFCMRITLYRNIYSEYDAHTNENTNGDKYSCVCTGICTSAGLYSSKFIIINKYLQRVVLVKFQLKLCCDFL